jgi:hypothetical protein
MNTRRIVLSLLLGLALVMTVGGLATAQTSTPISGDGVVPILGGTQPTCSDFGYIHGFKIDAWDDADFPTGDLTFTWTAGTQNGFPTLLTAGGPFPEVTVTINSADGLYLTWQASVYIDAVIVKGGPNSNVYIYPPQPPYNQDTGLSTPAAANAISHVEFCVGNPLAVTLASFTAEAQAGGVLATWETVSEVNNRGFNLYRGTSPDEPSMQLNQYLIPSQSQGTPSGFVYTWEDGADLAPGTTYFYWLEDLDIHGATALHGPVSVDFVGPTAVTLSDVSASPAAGAAALPWLWVVAAGAGGLALGLGRLRRRS